MQHEKAVAVSGVCAGVLEESSGKIPGKLLEKVARIAKFGSHLSTPALKTEDFSKKIGRFSKTRKIPGKSRENCWKIFLPNREMLEILGFRAPGKANLPGTLGRHCRDLVCTFHAGCFLKLTVPAFSSFSGKG